MSHPNGSIGWKPGRARTAVAHPVVERVYDLAEWLDNGGMRKPDASDISRERLEEALPQLQTVRKRTKPTTADLYEVFCAVPYLRRSQG